MRGYMGPVSRTLRASSRVMGLSLNCELRSSKQFQGPCSLKAGTNLPALTWTRVAHSIGDRVVGYFEIG